MLTVQILVKNNEKTIKKTLDSLVEIPCNIIVGDLGSRDKTLDICSSYKNLEIIDVKNKNISEARNELSREINMYLDPWEFLVKGKEILKDIKETQQIYVFQNEIISKELRIWTNEKFINPIYETIINKKAKINEEIVISSKNPPDDRKEKLKILEKWNLEKPFDVDVYYYLALCHLSLRNYEKFLFFSEEYFLRENKISSSYLMMKYYISQIKLHTNKLKESLECVLICISQKPEMAEFWCVLGDIYYKQNQVKKAKEFYENAILIGQKRRKEDELPIEINKYKKYPTMMIENINEIIKNTNFY
jgi:tetratricopeptide (TPR) repeat protein